MSTNKATRTFSTDEKAVLSSVYRLLKWKGLKNGADALAQEAGLSQGLLRRYTPALGEKEWNVFQNHLKAMDKYGSGNSEDESSSEDSEVESESETEVDTENDTDVRASVRQH